ncbi:Uncharacterized protein Rs2_00375 [Raphanus sativus]|nr:Uncharacterized protein Rs2_00375 [Raphanus sativus]
MRNYAGLLKSSTQLQQIGTPVEHVSGAPFVLIPDENIEAAKLEFKDFIYARFHGDYPSMGKIIGIVNAVWARTGPRIFVHNIGEGIYLLRVTNPRTREVLLSRSCWNIGGLPMFVAPWAPDYSPEEPPLTNAIVPVELRNVPYLLFNNESLSRLATAVGKPESLAPETERKENFEVAKLFVRVDLTTPLPNKIISGFTNGREVEIAVSYPWLPVKCDLCKKYGHISSRCSEGVAVRNTGKTGHKDSLPETSRRRSKSRPGRSTEKKIKQGLLRYIPVARNSSKDPINSLADEVTKTSEEVLAPTQETTVPETTQETPVPEVEEGEICEDVMDDGPVVVSASSGEIVLPHPVVEQQNLVDDQSEVVVVNESLIGDVLPVSPAPSVVIKADGVDELSGSTEADKVPTDEDEDSENAGATDVDDGLPTGVTDGAGVIVVVSDSVSDSADIPEVVAQVVEVTDEVPVRVEVPNEACLPLEEKEPEKPFILVNNRKSRKSSRKAARRH